MRAINALVRKNELIQVEGMKKKMQGNTKNKIISGKNDMSIKEIIESMTRMVENDSCGQSLIRLLRIHS